MKKRMLSAIIGSVLLAQANVAFAEVSATPNTLEGSDTWNQVMDTLFIDLALIDGNGIESYGGIGSSGGERQMIGNPNLALSEPACTDDNGGENSGCQEIAPMSREMGTAICAAGNSEAIGNAENIGACLDGIAVVTDNVTYGQYGDDAASCAAYSSASTDNTGAPPLFPDRGVGNAADSGVLPVSGYVLGGGSLGAGNEWRDVLRIIYTGCLNTDGNCMTATGTGNTSSGVPSRPRLARCGSDVRRELLSSWRNIVEGPTDCDGVAGDICSTDATPTDGIVDTGLKHAFRRDDSSGTTGAFLEFINVRANLGVRARVTATIADAGSATGCSPGAAIPARKLITPIPENFAFCDGGTLENFYPDCQNDTIIPIGGDPIRKNCSIDDDICGFDGKAAVVQAIKSTRGSNPYPTHQCSRGQFSKLNYIASAFNVCPDGTAPSGGNQCKFPYNITAGVTTFDCMNPNNSRPTTVPNSYDGRVYNVTMRTTAGVVDQPNANLAEIASWRYNMVDIVNAGEGTANTFGKVYAPADYVCTESDATRNIGCMVGRTTCSIGFAGREAAYTTANDAHLRNEALMFRDNTPSDTNIVGATYPLARTLYLSAIGGFENMSADCAARGDTADFCAEQLRIAQEFYNTGNAGNLMGSICEEAGFVARPAATCRGAFTAAGCGAPTSQALSACEPL